MAAGFRSLPPVPLGIAIPRRGPAVRGMLAFWMGGACAPFLPVPPIPPEPPKPPALVSAEGPPFAGRPFIDDEELIEFLKIWVVWNDVE